jgi:hypothetical protein
MSPAGKLHFDSKPLLIVPPALRTPICSCVNPCQIRYSHRQVCLNRSLVRPRHAARASRFPARRRPGELIPIARYIQYRYHEAYRVKVRWNAGSQRHDAVLLVSGDWVNHGLAAKRLAVEVTLSVHRNEHLVRENVDKGGASFGPENTQRDKKTDKIASEARAGDGWTTMQELAKRVTEQIRTKAAKGYGSDTVLIVGVVPNLLTFQGEWNEVVRQIVGKHPMNTTSPQGVDGRIVVA